MMGPPSLIAPLFPPVPCVCVCVADRGRQEADGISSFFLGPGAGCPCPPKISLSDRRSKTKAAIPQTAKRRGKKATSADPPAQAARTRQTPQSTPNSPHLYMLNLFLLLLARFHTSPPTTFYSSALGEAIDSDTILCYFSSTTFAPQHIIPSIISASSSATLPQPPYQVGPHSLTSHQAPHIESHHIYLTEPGYDTSKQGPHLSPSSKTS